MEARTRMTRMPCHQSATIRTPAQGARIEPDDLRDDVKRLNYALKNTRENFMLKHRYQCVPRRWWEQRAHVVQIGQQRRR